MKAGLAHIQMDSFGPGNGGDGFVKPKARNGDDDLIPGIQNAKQRGKKGLARPNGDENLVRFHSVSPAGFEVCHRFPQDSSALIGSVVGLVTVQGSNSCILDGFRGVKIRLADGQLDAAGGGVCQVGVDPNIAAFQSI